MLDYYYYYFYCQNIFKGTILEGMEEKGTDLTKDDKEVLDKQKVEFKENEKGNRKVK